MAIVLDHALGRTVNHDHTTQLNSLYLLKAGDTATGVINLIASVSQGNNLAAAVNLATTPLIASHVSIVDAGNYYTSTNVEGALQEIGALLFTDHEFRRILLLMGA